MRMTTWKTKELSPRMWAPSASSPVSSHCLFVALVFCVAWWEVISTSVRVFRPSCKLDVKRVLLCALMPSFVGTVVTVMSARFKWVVSIFCACILQLECSPFFDFLAFFEKKKKIPINSLMPYLILCCSKKAGYYAWWPTMATQRLQYCASECEVTVTIPCCRNLIDIDFKNACAL